MPDGQVTFQYADAILNTLEKFLSAERLASYYSITRGNRWIGIQLYERNTECSEALYGVIQGLEVALRNAIHNIMTDAVGTQEWYDKVAWDEPELNAIQEAKQKIKDRQLKETPGRVIAELTFGFWVKLTSSNYEQSLWFKYLHKIVPKTVRRKVLHGKLIQAKTLRNRIAHHERIVGRTRDLPSEYQELIEIIGWLHLDIRAWVEFKNCFTERYRNPLKKKRPEPEANQAADASQINKISN
jgi:hypothetical protein